MKKNFTVIGKLVTDSAFENKVYQSNISTSGSLLGALKGTHYNRAWFTHNMMSEGLERLFLSRFLQKKESSLHIKIYHSNLHVFYMMKSSFFS